MNALKAAREKAKLRVSEVAEKIGVTTTAVYLWESGATTPDTAKLVPLSDLYGCTVDVLLRGEHPKRKRAK